MVAIRMCSDSEACPRLLSKYEFVKDLGKGAFGFVVLARDRVSGELVAIKKLEREFLQARYAESELLNHSMLQHHHVVGFREVFLSPRHINIVMDYASGGSLFAYVQQRQRLREPLARWFFQQVVLAVDYCHRKGVSNRDIKLDNTLLHMVDGLPLPLVKICDFGYSKHDARSSARSRVGTLHYMAPEVLQGHAPYDAKKADVWSIGVLLYTMLMGRYPFPRPSNGEGVGQMMRLMAARQYALPASLGLSEGCAKLLRRLLEPDARARITLEQVMEDPWFHSHLPAGALDMNARALAADAAPDACARRAESGALIRAVVAAAAAGAGAGGGGGFVQDSSSCVAGGGAAGVAAGAVGASVGA